MAALGLPKRVIDRIVINPPVDAVLLEDQIPVYVEPERFKRVITVGDRTWTITGKTDFIGEGRVQDFKSTSVYTYQKQTGAQKFTLQGSIYRWLAPKIITEPTLDNESHGRDRGGEGQGGDGGTTGPGLGAGAR